MAASKYTRGWDGASWQGIPVVSLMLVNGFFFVLEKITGEGNYINLIWSVIRELCYKAGVRFGGYDWVEPQLMDGPESGAWYARNYLRVYQPRPGDIIGVDLETPEWFTGPLGRNIEAAMRAYFFTLRDESRAKILVYTARYFLLEIGADKWDWFCEKNGFYLWQAAPGPTATLPDDADWPGTPAPFRETIVHQYDWHRTLPGVIAGEFDVNRIRISLDEFVELLGVPGEGGGQVSTQNMVPVPPEGKWGTIVMPNGNTVTVLNFGGQTPPNGVKNTTIVDIGVDVVSMHDPNVMEHRSFQNQVANDWIEYRPDPVARLAQMGLDEHGQPLSDMGAS